MAEPPPQGGFLLAAAHIARISHTLHIASTIMNRRPVAGDLAYGVAAIADCLGVKPRQAMRLVAQNRIPFWREGRTVCSRRSSLVAWLAEREAAARQPASAAA